MEQEFEWVHPNGMVVKRLSRAAVRNLYDGHEIASHTLTHPYMNDKTEEELMWEIGEDKRRLEALFGREVAGFAVPFSYYDEKIASCVRKCGFEYGRCSEPSHSYSPWQDVYRWKTGIFHLAPGFDAFVDGFFQTSEELALCQIVGHSYDLDAEQMWGKMEAIFSKISKNKEILPMTHLEIVRYLSAMAMAEIGPKSVRNLSGIELWFRMDGRPVMLRPGEEYHI